MLLDNKLSWKTTDVSLEVEQSTRKIVPVVSYEPCPEDVCRSGSRAPHILKLGTRWKRVLRFALSSLYLMVKVLSRPSSKRLVCPEGATLTLPNGEESPIDLSKWRGVSTLRCQVERSLQLTFPSGEESPIDVSKWRGVSN